MTRLRAEKVKMIQNFIPDAKPDSGNEKARLVVLGWGSTCGAIKTAVKELIAEGYDIAHIHLRYINPFPKNLGELLYGYDQVLIPEMNHGQLLQLIRAEYLIPATGFSKMQGLPFTTIEIKQRIIDLLNA
jgi:2-oxoglutarate ferredoxin oxidoreductase subunit alpha